jgi:DMSO/TMAO reductase YedYZ molybdopterin-dependent catalytic subunit
MKTAALVAALALAAAVSFGQPAAKELLPPDTPKSRIIDMDPAKVDPRLLPFDRIDQLQATGTPQQVDDIAAWRLTVTGAAVNREVSLGYEELLSLATAKKGVLLICPGVFEGYLSWEGVPLSDILAKAGARPDYKMVAFHAYDGYTETFTRRQVEEHLLFLALRVNGAPLPRSHGYPVRLVAEDFYGGRWVKWLTRIRVE